MEVPRQATLEAFKKPQGFTIFHRKTMKREAWDTPALWDIHQSSWWTPARPRNGRCFQALKAGRPWLPEALPKTELRRRKWRQHPKDSRRSCKWCWDQLSWLDLGVLFVEIIGSQAPEAYFHSKKSILKDSLDETHRLSLRNLGKIQLKSF